MNTQCESFDEVKSIIPSELWDKYKHLSYAEMASEPELAEWKNELLEYERLWLDIWSVS